MHDKSSAPTGASRSSSSSSDDPAARDPHAPATSPNYASLSGQELDAALSRLLAEPDETASADELQRAVHELQVHRCELEMQNRALRDAQDELEQAVHRYSDLYDSLPIGYVTLSQDGRITEANLAAAELFGVARAELIGGHLRRHLGGEDQPGLPAFLESCLESRERQTLLATLLRDDGSTVPVQIAGRRAHTLAVNDLLIRAAVIDLSELKETQRALEGVIAEQENFAYSISHDLRSPLLTIKGFAGMLAEERSTLGDEQVTEIVGRLNRAAGRMDALLTSLLDYTRVSRRSIPIEQVSLADVVNDVLLQHETLIQERGAEVAVRPPLPDVMASRGLLGQALAHLLTNALKFTAPDRPPSVQISAVRGEQTIVLAIADDGIGIAPQHHERIFRIFERLHGSSAYPGTGIGLALVRRAAERMRGRVWVESEEGKGARFYLELPRG